MAYFTSGNTNTTLKKSSNKSERNEKEEKKEFFMLEGHKIYIPKITEKTGAKAAKIKTDKFELEISKAITNPILTVEESKKRVKGIIESLKMGTFNPLSVEKVRQGEVINSIKIQKAN